jgi:hypothetical protein
MELLQLDLWGAPQDRATLATKCYSCDKDLTTQEKHSSEKITDKGEYLRVMCEACELEEHEHNERLDAYYKWEAEQAALRRQQEELRQRNVNVLADYRD